MSRPAPPKRTFEWTVIAFTGLCVVLLFGLMVNDLFSRGGAAPEPTVLSHSDAAPAAQYSRGIPQRLIKPLTVQYPSPPSKLNEILDRMGYRLDRVRRHGEVPRLFFASLPEELLRIRQAKERKAVFIKTALPLILQANELILRDREKLLSLRSRTENGTALTADERAWLAEKAGEYGLAEPDLARLGRRIDIIPPSLALAQSAEESGWGTSRFAHEGNAIFGQRTWQEDEGIIPLRREEDETFKVRIFDRLIDGVRSYALNLNSHPAYQEFRGLREALRQRGESPDGEALAATLLRYSERGMDYVAAIRSIIRVNGLRAFDRARLGDGLELEAAIAPDA